MAVDLHLPPRPGGEPVVVVAVKDHRRVVRNPSLLHQPPEVAGRDDVALQRVAELCCPIPGDRTRNVPLVVPTRVDVDFDDTNVRIALVRHHPGGVDQHVGISILAHENPPCWFPRISASVRRGLVWSLRRPLSPAYHRASTRAPG